MNYIFLVSLIISMISGLFALVKQFQMLQQNSYFISRYFGWIKESYSISASIECIAFCISSLLILKDLYLLQMLCMVAVLLMRIAFAINSQKKSIKKLVFTGRIKRFFGAAIVIFAILLAVYFIFLNNLLVSDIASLLILLISFISPVLCIICRLITAPIDWLFTKWYINDAKRILKAHKNLIVIGITGSYGKTTTKFILNRILSEKYNVLATPQSFNTPMGVVRTIRESLKPQTQIFICEMGAKKVGDIKEICDIVHPNYGIITSVGPQHLDTFKSVDNVFKTKFELADEVLKNGGEVFVNGDSAELISRIDKSLYNIYGTNEDFTCHAEDITYGKNGSEFTAVLGEEKVNISSKLLGLHSIMNIIGASAVATRLSLKPSDIAFASASLKPTEHRLELKPYINGSALIDDAYNSNPEGCLEAVNVLASFEGMTKVIVTPGLIELGEKEYDCNFALGVEAAKKCDIIILVGLNRSKPIKDGVESVGFSSEKLFTVASFKDAMKIYSEIADRNTVVLFENDLPDNYLY